MKLPREHALRATGATLQHPENAPAFLRVSTDTRTIEPGDSFLALRGDRYDGHDFIDEAVRRGAAMIIVERVPSTVAVPAMVVDDTLAAYMALAGAARELFSGCVVGITGSAGKTTTKAFVEALLRLRYRDRVLAAPANENNEIGVSKLLLEASRGTHDVLVVEMGARKFGDVAALVAIARPDVGILTNVGEAHVEIMGSRERLAETKWALFERGARPVLNADDEISRRRGERLADAHWFAALAANGSIESLVNFSNVTALIGAQRLFHRSPRGSQEVRVDVRVPGAHNRANLAAAVAGALELDVPLDRIAAQISELQLPPGRYEGVRVDGLRLIYDAYNANASSMIAALDAFGSESAARRIAVLASMAELGDESEVLHERIGEHAAQRVDVLLVQGDFAGALARGAQRGGLSAERIVDVATNARAAAWLREHARSDDVVLLKGSRKYKLEEIVEELRA
jgi:UDP-N-acetylmuramoyl-tripeptide--D-alanyl-D-alanine ligase